MKFNRIFLAWLFTALAAISLAIITGMLWQREKALSSGKAAPEMSSSEALLVVESPSGKGEGMIYVLHLNTGQKEVLAEGVDADETMADSNASRIAYVRYQEGQFILYVLDLASGEEEEIYRVDSSSVNSLWLSSWSPTGEHFFVMTATSSGHRPSGTLYLVSVAGRKLHKLGQGLITARPEWTPDGSIAFYGLKSRGYPAVYMLEPGNPKPQEVDMVSESFAVSPDGSEVAYVTYSYTRGANELRVWDIKAGKSRSIASGALSGNNKHVLFWSPDGSEIFYLAGSGYLERDLYVVKEGEAPRNLTSDFGGMVTEAALSPDGSHIAVSIVRSFQTFEGDLVLINPETGESKKLVESKRTPAWLSWSPDGRLLALSEVKVERKGMSFNVIGAALSVLDLETGEVYPVAEGQRARALGWVK